MIKLIDLTQVNVFFVRMNLYKTMILFVLKEIQMKLSNNAEELTDELLLNLLQIRIYLSMFRLGSNYTVQVY
jgi:hypothetical protein